MTTLLVSLAVFVALIAFVYMVVWAMVRASEEKGRQEAENNIHKAQTEDALRRLKNALEADARARAESARGSVQDHDDGHRRD